MTYMPENIPPNGHRLFLGYRNDINASNVVLSLIQQRVGFEHEYYNGVHYLYFQRQKDLRKGREIANDVYNASLETE